MFEEGTRFDLEKDETFCTSFPFRKLEYWNVIADGSNLEICVYKKGSIVLSRSMEAMLDGSGMRELVVY